MKQITTFLIALLFTGAVNAQLIQFQKTYGDSLTDRCWSVVQTSDGGYVFAGETNSVSAGSYDAYLTKTDAYGAVQWTRTYGGTAWDWAYTVRQTADGGYIVVGGTESSGSGLGDIWIFKTNSSGIISWQRTVGSPGGDSGNDIIQTSDGGYAAAGFQNAGASDDNACLVKMDGSGNVQWIRTYSLGTDGEYGYSVAQAQDGGYILGGESYDGIGSIALVIKTDANGNVQWANSYGGTDDHWINSIVALPSGNYTIGGASWQTSSYDIWLAKLNPNGTPIWSNAYAGPGTGTDICLWFTSAPDGGYAVCGRSNSFTTNHEAFLMKTDSTGGPEWSMRYGGTANEAANQVITSTNGGYVLASNSLSFGNGESAYLIKTDSTGGSGCNESIPSFLMSNITTPFSNVTVLDSALTNVAPSTLTFSSPTLTETPLCFTVGEKEFAAPEDLISIYPNPATNELHVISNTLLEKGLVEIYDAIGKMVFSQELKANNRQQKIDTDVSGWSKGVYLVRIKTQQGMAVKKLVKQ